MFELFSHQILEAKMQVEQQLKVLLEEIQRMAETELYAG